MKKLEAVIFDLDGTIIKSFIDFQQMKERVIKTAIEYRIKIPKGRSAVLEMLDKIYRENRRDKNIKNFKEKAEEIIIEEEMKGIEKAYPHPDMIILLKNLKKAGIKTGIITRNCRKAAEKIIKKFSIPFDVLLTRDDVKRVKPDTYHLEKIIEKMGIKKDASIIVGDHYFDILCGKKAGILTCGIVRDGKFENIGAEEPDFIFESGEGLAYLTGIKKFKSGKLPAPFLNYLIKKYTSVGKEIIRGPGIGVDCAIFKTKSNIIHAKSDPIMLVSKDVGYYLININANDISVSGGKPEWFLSTIVFPENISFYEIEDVFRQISEECKELDIKWVGGHTEIFPPAKSLITSGFMLGTPLKRKKAGKIKRGDNIFIVKEAGIEAASIIAREKESYLKKFFSERYIEKVKNSIKNPGIGVSEQAQFLWENFKIKLMHDPTEGGISTALYELSKVSGYKISVFFENIPFYPPAKKLCKIFNLNISGIISSGCIIGITSEDEVRKIEKAYKKKKVKFAVIGKLEEKGYGVFIKKGKKYIKMVEFQKDEITRLFS